MPRPPLPSDAPPTPLASPDHVTGALAPRTVLWLRRGLVSALCAWAVTYLRAPDPWALIDHVNLAVHEAGHLVFAPFGTFMTALGGTLLQLLLPLAFALRFLRRGEHFAGYVTLGWTAQSLWNVARYVADARAQALPLVGGGEHDWTYLLAETGLLAHDAAVAGVVRVGGVCLFAVAMGLAWMHAPPAPPPVNGSPDPLALAPPPGRL
jgi:hypothetical protein